MPRPKKIKETPVVVEKPKRTRKKKEPEIVIKPQETGIREEKEFLVNLWDFDTFTKVKSAAIVVNKKGTEIAVSADENKQTLKFSVVDMKHRGSYSDWMELTFEELISLIDFLREAPDLKKKYEKLQKKLEKKKNADV